MIQNCYQKPLKGNKVGIVFGSFAPLHQGHLDLIMRAKRENDGGALIISCGYHGDKGEPLMPHSKRYRYVREFFANDDLVAVYSINDTETGVGQDNWPGWLEEFEKIWKTAVEPELDISVFPADVRFPDRVWYVGDEEYYDELTKRGEECVLVDRMATNPICATMIRNNPIKNWDRITFPFRRIFSHNILICGTASEGKTTLVQDLGKYFNAPYSYEYAREYMKESCVSDSELDGADFIAFLEGQYNLNKKLINSPANHGLFFADTDSMVTKMYSEYYSMDESCILTPSEYEEIAKTADALTKKCRWDKIFLIGPKNIFHDDHERYMAHADLVIRNDLYEILCKNIKEAGYWDKVEILDGNFYENFTKVVDYVNGVINK